MTQNRSCDVEFRSCDSVGALKIGIVLNSDEIRPQWHYKQTELFKDELEQFLDIEVHIALTPEQWSKILEQILLVVLILGR